MTDTSTILVVDDTVANLDALVALLDDYDVIDVISGAEALEVANRENLDLILLDIMMPDMDGYEVCRRLKESDRTKNIPIIFITAKTDENSIEQAYDSGGIDYVTKPFMPKELLARVKNILKLHQLIKHLEFISSRDYMTGILNRRKFFELGVEKYSNHNNLHAVMIDIDEFKKINDSYGHSVGDQVIKLVTVTIQEKLTEDTIFGRLGGEEFAILRDVAESEDIVDEIESLRRAVEDLEITTDNGDCIKFTVIQGISKRSEKIANLDELLQSADNALYEAKGSGRNKSIFRV